MLLLWAQSGGMNANNPIFSLPLADLGAGAVDTTPTIAAGSPTATFTRATVAWTKLSTGLWAQVASGTARSCYTGADTTVGSYGGFFQEGAGIQLVTPTASIRDMTDASWVAVNVTAAKTATGIDGAVNSASTLTATGNGGTILQTLLAAGSSRTYSVWLRRKTGVGTITIQQGATTSDVTAQLNAVTYTRVSLNANILNSAYGIIFGTSGDAVEADFNQFEAGAFATSPMASAGAARNMDSLRYPGSGNATGTIGSLYVEGVVPSLVAGQLQDFMDLNVALTTQLPLYLPAGGATVNMYDGTTLFAGPNFSVSNSVQKFASNWGASTMNTFYNGAAGAGASFDGDMNVGTNIQVGANGNGNQSLFGMMKNLRIYGSKLSGAQLQALTT